jgi:hypothetical protein
MHAGSGAVNRAYPRDACEQQFEISGVGEDDQPREVWLTQRALVPTPGRGANVRPFPSFIIAVRSRFTKVAARPAQVPVYVLAVLLPA